jgi:hypothetical protein
MLDRQIPLCQGSIRKGFKVCKGKFPKRTALRAFRDETLSFAVLQARDYFGGFAMPVARLALKSQTLAGSETGAVGRVRPPWLDGVVTPPVLPRIDLPEM